MGCGLQATPGVEYGGEGSMYLKAQWVHETSLVDNRETTSCALWEGTGLLEGKTP